MTPRPVAVTILGWVFAVLSGLAVLGSIFVVLLASFMPLESIPQQLPPDVPPAFGLIFSMFRYFLWIATLQMLVAAFSLFAAIQFLKLRSWSRVYFEILCWIRLCFSTLFVIFFSVTWISGVTSLPLPSDARMPPPAVFAGFGIAIGLFGLFFNGAILGGLIWLLRSKHVRPAFLSTATLPG